MGDMRQPEQAPTDGTEPTPNERAPWTPPAVTELPRLTELTLQTGGAIHGGGNTGGSTVF